MSTIKEIKIQHSATATEMETEMEVELQLILRLNWQPGLRMNSKPN